MVPCTGLMVEGLSYKSSFLYLEREFLNEVSLQYDDVVHLYILLPTKCMDEYTVDLRYR